MTRSMPVVVLFAFGIQFTASIALAQQPPAPSAPARDRAPDAAPAGAISGRILDAQTGAPLRRATIRINGAGLREAKGATTDVDGRYEVTELPAGVLQVTASRTGYLDLSYGQRQPLEPFKQLTLRPQQRVEHIDFALPRAGIITGRVLDEFGDPVQDASITPLRLMYANGGRRPTQTGRGATTNDIGEFRLYGMQPGDFYITAAQRSVGFPTMNEDRGGYALTYYPGTPNVSEAQAIRLGAGQTLTDVTITLAPARLAKVSGMAFDANGELLRQGSVNVMLNQSNYFSSAGFGQIRPDGTFVVNNVPPGEYRISANTNTSGINNGPPPDQPTAIVAVNGTDIANLRLDVPRRLSLRGRVVIDGSVTEQPRIERVQLTAQPTGPTVIIGSVRSATVTADATFEIQVLPSPMVMIRATGLPAGWIVKRIRRSVADVTDGMPVAEDMDDLEVEVTNRVSEIAGVVANARNEVAPDIFAVVFPVDMESRRRVTFYNGATVRTDDQGKFRFRALRPGEYFVVAVSRMEQGQWLDVDYQESLIPVATRVTLGDGETATINLKLSDER